MQYLYLFNYPPEEENLCKLEFKYLFHDIFDKKEYLTNQNIDENVSIFIKAKIDIFIMSKNFCDILTYIKESKLFYLDFKVIYVKNSITHLDYNDTVDYCKQVAYDIDGSVNMHHPKHILAITKLEDQWIFGYYHHGKPTWKKHDKKPYTFSNSLSVRLARTLINIAGENNKDITMIDPCCGMGTVVLEGLGLGYQIVGFDISREVSWSARKNLYYFGYDGMLIKRGNIHDLQGHYDVAIIDIPYNLYTFITYEEQLAILASSRNICDKLILVSYENMQQELRSLNFQVVDSCFIPKGNMKRYVFVCKKRFD